MEFRFSHTNCHFGGARHWLRCKWCGRRCAIVYGLSGDGYFACRRCLRLGYGSEAEKIQDAYLSGRKDEAASFVPAELIERTSLIGPEGFVADRVAALKESGVTTLNVTPLAATHAERVALIEKIRDLAG